MATLKVRYGGNVVSIDEGFNYNPQNYGTKRFKIRINANSTMKLGLTTNTNAKDYCKLAIRVGGQTAYIGRVSSTSYISGSNVNYNGSSTTSRSQSTSSSSRSYTSSATSKFPYVASSMRTATASSTYEGGIISSSTSTRNSQEYSNTMAADPTIYISTNAYGSTNRSRTASENVASLTYYSFTYSYANLYCTDQRTNSSNWQPLGVDRSQYRTTSRLFNYESTYGSWSFSGTRYTQMTYVYNNYYTGTDQYDPPDWSVTTISTTRRMSATVSSNETKDSTEGAWRTTNTNSYNANYDLPAQSYAFSVKYYTRTKQNTYTARQLTVASIRSTTGSTYTSKYYRSYIASRIENKEAALRTVYESSKRWTYWESSCSIYDVFTYETKTDYSTSATSSTTSVSETMHNMNL